jgi:UDPglucose 6-dehydrogenase
MNLGVIGYGTVGEAVARGFDSLGHDVWVNDIEWVDDFPMKSKEEIAEECEYTMICVNAPTNGTVDLSQVRSVLDDLPNTTQAVLRSTVPPGTTRMLAEEYDRTIIYNPEFLTEENALGDFMNPDRIVIGGPGRHSFSKVYMDVVDDPDDIVLFKNPSQAEMVKYAANTLLATKVSFANQIDLICDEFDIDSKEVMDVVIQDERINSSHLDPTKGPFGGMCLPKDLRAIMNETETETPLYEAVHEINQVVKDND